MRKDLLLRSVEAFHYQHQQRFPNLQEIINLNNGKAVSNGEYVEKTSSFVRHDHVGEVVADYGEYDTKIESLAQLRALDTFRSEFAMLSLGRAYTDRCVKRGGSWTSGIHLLWWTKRRLLESTLPEPGPSDFRYSATGSLDRQVELAIWSLLMFRLTFISDLGTHSEKTEDSIEGLSTIAEQAAGDTEVPSRRKLISWLARVGRPMLERAMPERRYRAITATLLRQQQIAGAIR